MDDWRGDYTEARRHLCKDCRNGVQLSETPPTGCPQDWGPTHVIEDDGAWPCSASAEDVEALVVLFERAREIESF